MPRIVILGLIGTLGLLALNFLADHQQPIILQTLFHFLQLRAWQQGFEYFDIISYVGYILSWIGMTIFIWGIWRARNADAIAYWFLFLQHIVMTLLTIYTILIESVPLTIGNAVILFQWFLSLLLTIYYKHFYKGLSRSQWLAEEASRGIVHRGCWARLLRHHSAPSPSSTELVATV